VAFPLLPPEFEEPDEEPLEEDPEDELPEDELLLEPELSEPPPKTFRKNVPASVPLPL